MRISLLPVKSLFLALAVFAAVSVSAQSEDIAHKAAINNDMLIELATEKPLDTYTVDVSHIKFESEETAYKFYNSFTDNLIQVQYMYKQNAISLTLNSQYLKEPWGVEQWNEYLAERAPKMAALYDQMKDLK